MLRMMKALVSKTTVVFYCIVAAVLLPAAASAMTLDENCMVNILNRTVQVSPNGRLIKGDASI